MDLLEPLWKDRRKLIRAAGPTSKHPAAVRDHAIMHLEAGKLAKQAKHAELSEKHPFMPRCNASSRAVLTFTSTDV